MRNKKVVLLDGAMGTYLEKKGYKGITPEYGCIEVPELIEEIHTEYVKNGAEIILTNTFGANKLRLSKKKLEDKLEEINSKATEIAKRVKEKFKHVKIAGDIGPTGELIYPYGNLEKEKAGEVFGEQGKILEKNGVDFLLLETFQDLEELKIAYYYLKEKTSLPIIPCLTFNKGKEYRTLMGQRVEDFVKWAEEEKIEVIGTNCGIGSAQMKEVVKEFRNLTEKPLWVKPNAGMPEIISGRVVYPETVEEFGKNCMEMSETVDFIGGCCGTTPEYIRFIKENLNGSC